MNMINRSGRPLAGGPLLATVIGALVTADFFLILDGRMPITLIHTLIACSLVVAAIKLFIDHARRTAVAEVLAGLMATASHIDARRCCCTEVTEPLRVVATASVRGALPMAAELPPDNVLSFELGRQVERDTRH